MYKHGKTEILNSMYNTTEILRKKKDSWPFFIGYSEGFLQ